MTAYDYKMLFNDRFSLGVLSSDVYDSDPRKPVYQRNAHMRVMQVLEGIIDGAKFVSGHIEKM